MGDWFRHREEKESRSDAASKEHRKPEHLKATTLQGAFLPSDVAEFRDTVVWTKFDPAELAEGDVNEVEHPSVLRI